MLYNNKMGICSWGNNVKIVNNGENGQQLQQVGGSRSYEVTGGVGRLGGLTEKSNKKLHGKRRREARMQEARVNHYMDRFRRR